MSNHFAIATVTAALRRILQDAVGHDVGNTTVTSQPPDTIADPPSNTLNIFLYQVTQNNGYSNLDLPTRNSVGELIEKPMLGLNLHYLLTAYGDGNNDLLAHRILASAMGVLHEKPMLTREIIHDTIHPSNGATPLDDDLKDSDLENQAELVKLAHQPLSLEDITKLWSSFFQSRYRISVSYQATMVLLESEKQPRRVLPVSDRRLYVLQFRHPVIDRIEPQILEKRADAKITLTGRNLKADDVSVHFDRIASVPKPEDIKDDRILTAIPPNLTTGIKSVRVVHPLLLGSPAVEHKGFESNTVSFVLAPRITKIAGSDLPGTGASIIITTIARNSVLGVEFEPAVTSRQKKVFLLIGDLVIPVQQADVGNAVFTWQNVPGSHSNRLKQFLRNIFGVNWIPRSQEFTQTDDKKTITISAGTHSLSIKLDYEPSSATSATMTIDNAEIYEFIVKVANPNTTKLCYGNSLSINPKSDPYKGIIPTGFPIGTYVIRLRVDGVESLLTVDANQQSPTYRQFIGPRIAVR